MSIQNEKKPNSAKRQTIKPNISQNKKHRREDDENDENNDDDQIDQILNEEFKDAIRGV